MTIAKLLRRTTSKLLTAAGLATVLLLLAGLPANAATSQRLRLTNAGNGGPHDVVTDGRYVSWSGAGGTAVVTRDTRERTTKSFGVPAGCTFRQTYRGRVLFACQASPATGGLPSVATSDVTGADFRVAGTYDPNRYRPGFLGRHWISLGQIDRATVVLYLNWRTGERRETSARVDPHTPDLGPRPKWAPDNPRILRTSLSEKAPLRVLYGTKRLRLSECKTGCRRVKLAFNRVGWIEGRTLHIVRLRDRRSWTTRLSSATTSLFNPYALTKYEVIVDRDAGGEYEHLRGRI